MNILLDLYFLINIALVYCQVTEEEVHRAKESYSQMMKHDGLKRVKVITKNNAQKLLDKYHLVVILYWIDNKEEKEKINPKEMEVLEVKILQYRLLISSFALNHEPLPKL